MRSGSGCYLAFGVHLAPVEVGREHARVVQVERVDREDISIEHDEISELAGLQTTGGTLLLERVGRIDRIGIDGILKGDALFGQQRLLAPGLAAGDGVLHCRKRIEGADTPITAAGNQCPGVP